MKLVNKSHQLVKKSAGQKPLGGWRVPPLQRLFHMFLLVFLPLDLLVGCLLDLFPNDGLMVIYHGTKMYKVRNHLKQIPANGWQKFDTWSIHA